MIINKITRKSHAWNEDRFVIGKDFYIVIDGATPLIKKDGVNLACLMVKYIKENINKYSGRIKNRLEQISNDLYEKLNLDTNDTAYLPSASLSFVERIGDEYHIGIVGDCEVTAFTKDGMIRYFDDSLSKLDNISLTNMINIAKEKNINIIDARKDIQDILIKHRRMINQENGYNAYTLGKGFKLNVREYILKVDEVKKLYLYSDGFAQSFTNLQVYKNHQEMFGQITDIKEEVEKIKERAFSDALCNQHPRFKIIDDITIVEIITD